MAPPPLDEIGSALTALGPRFATDGAAARVTRCYDDARVTWPSLAVAPRAFAASLAAVVDAVGSLDGALATLHGSDLYLARAVTDGDSAARELLLGRYRGALDDACARLAVLDEDRAVVCDAALASLARYTGQESLAAWLRAAVAYQVAVATAGDTGGAPSIGSAEGDDGEVSPAVSEAVTAAFARAAQSLSVRERNVLRFHLHEGLGLDDIGRIYRRSRADVAGWLSHARHALLEAARRDVVAQPDEDVRAAALDLLESRLDAVVGQRMSTVEDERNTDPERPSALGETADV